MTRIEDFTGTLILLMLAAGAIAAAGVASIYACELCACAVAWVGLGPLAGWAIVGAAAGGTGALVQGLKLRGRSDNLRKVWAGVALGAAALLTAGALSPAGRALLGQAVPH